MRKIFLRHQTAFWITALLLLYVVSVVVNLGVFELAGEEPRRAVVSIEMLHSGNFIKPTLLGWNYYNKPPVFHWILAACIWLTGSASETVLRLPSLLFYLLMAAVLYKVNCRFFPKSTALLTAFFLLTCCDLYAYGLANGAEIDVFYSFVVYLQALAIFWFFTKGKFLKLYLLSYFFCSLGFLTKGFPSLVFQGLTLIALCFFAKSSKPLFRWQHAAGLLLFAGLIGFYFFLYNKQSSATRYFINLLNESLIKSAIGERSQKLVDKATLYPWLFFKLLLPWSLLLLALFKKIKFGLWQNPLTRFSALFIVFNLWVYWFTGQPKIRYVYMFLPFACTILGHIYQVFTEAYPLLLQRILKYFSAAFVIVLPGLFALPFFATVSIPWLTLLAVALGIFLFCYLRYAVQRIWLLITGVVLLRLIYAALFIPLQYKGIRNLQREVAVAAQATNNSPLQYLSPAEPFSVAVNNLLVHYNLETIGIPPMASYQIPYYWYRHTGHIVRYDTVPHQGTAFFSFASQMNGGPVDTLHSFVDKNFEQQVVFYQLKKQQATQSR